MNIHTTKKGSTFRSRVRKGATRVIAAMAALVLAVGFFQAQTAQAATTPILTGTYVNRQDDGSILMGMTSNDPNAQLIVKLYNVNTNQWFMQFSGQWSTWPNPQPGVYWICFEVFPKGADIYGTPTDKFTWPVQINWRMLNGQWQYFSEKPNSSGGYDQYLGWFNIDGKYYYFDPATGYRFNQGTWTLEGRTYTSGSDGAVTSGLSAIQKQVLDTAKSLREQVGYPVPVTYWSTVRDGCYISATGRYAKGCVVENMAKVAIGDINGRIDNVSDGADVMKHEAAHLAIIRMCKVPNPPITVNSGSQNFETVTDAYAELYYGMSSTHAYNPPQGTYTWAGAQAAAKSIYAGNCG